MKQGTFEHEIYIEAKPKDIVSFLVEHTNHPRFHPLIIDVKEVAAPQGVLRRFMITDQLIWGRSTSRLTTAPMFSKQRIMKC